MIDDMKHEKVLFLFFMSFHLGLRKWLKAVRRVWKS